MNSSYALSSAPPFDLRKSENETVFIAANIIDGNLISGSWGESLIGLVEAIGTERVWVSVFGGPRDALDLLREKLDGVGVERERVWIVSEEEEPLDALLEFPPLDPEEFVFRPPRVLNLFRVFFVSGVFLSD